MRPVALVLVVLSLLVASAYVVYGDPLTRSADSLISECRNSPYPPSCYEERLTLKADEGLSMEDAFSLIARVQERAPDYFYCHALGHTLATHEVAKDPTAWTDVLARCPSGVCSNGCLHGAAQGRFRTDTPSADDVDASLPELVRACANTSTHTFTALEKRECRHGLGHLALYLTNGNVTEALRVCTAVTDGEYIEHERACAEGVFMQLTRPLEPEDEALVKDTAPKTLAEVTALCARLSGPERSACDTDARAFMQWQEPYPTPTQIDTLCAEGPTEWNDRCHTDLMGAVGAQLSYDWDKLTAYCDGANGFRKEACFGDIAFGALFSDRALAEEAVAFCTMAEKRGRGERCYRTMLFFSAYGFLPGSESAQAFCSLLPSPWRSSCEKGEGEALVSAILSQPHRP